jgi:hypothetical protein
LALRCRQRQLYNLLLHDPPPKGGTMADQQTGSLPEPAPAHVLTTSNRILQYVAIAVAAFGLYTAGTTAYTATQKAVILTAEANNAADKLSAEATFKEQEARIGLETARNAVQRTKGEADTVEFEADKIAAEAISARGRAANQEEKASALVLNTQYEIGLKKAEAFKKFAEWRYLLQQGFAEVEKLEADNATKRYVLRRLVAVTRGGYRSLLPFGR